MLKNLLRRLRKNKSRSTRRRPSHRRPRIEGLAKRELLASDIGAIVGTAHIDLAGDGLTADDILLAGVEVRLFRDGGDGVFGGDDTLVATTTTGALAGPAPGQFRFDGLSPGLYFIEQDNSTAPAGLIYPAAVPVTVVNDGGVRIELIDDYSTADQLILADSLTPTISASDPAASAIGGARDIQAEFAAGVSGIEVRVVTSLELLGLSAGIGTSGTALIQYDGDDGTIALDATGLGGVSLGGGLPGEMVDPGAAFVLAMSGEAGADITIRVYSDATNFSTVTIPSVSSVEIVEMLIPFTMFTTGGGAGADFNNVGAIEAFVELAANVDVFVSIVETIQPDLVVANLTQFEPLTIGNQVFRDLNDNGILDGGEVGIADVAIELYRLEALTDVVDPLTQTPIATTTTDANGIYSFADLEPGFYAAVVPASQFDVAGPLSGFRTSLPTPETAGANANVDNDDDGRAVDGQAFVITETFQLISRSEPGADGNTNDTIDFGFFLVPVTDLSIVKTAETTTGTPISQTPPAVIRTGDTIVYRLIGTNSGPADATGVTIVDTLPSDVTFVGATLDGVAVAGGSFNSATGELTVEVGDLAVDEQAVVLITVTVNRDAADLITNPALIFNTPNTDGNPDNNDSSVNTPITRAVDLAVLKAVSTLQTDNTAAVFGAPITFEITVTNTAGSPGDARGFTVTDTLPAGLTLVADSFDAMGTGVTIASVGQELTFTGVPLAVGESVSFKFDALIAQDAATQLTNTAVVLPINAGGIVDVDINDANDQDAETITPERRIELVVTKDDNFTAGQSATPGGNIVYTIVVQNDGPSHAVNVNVLDTLPAGVTATSITLDGENVTDNNPDAGLLGFVIPVVGVGAANAVSVQVTALIGATVTATSITNRVEVSGGGVGDLPAGNIAEVTTPLTRVVDVAIVKTGPTAAVVPGAAPITYNLAISNSGPSVATNVNVADTLPPGVTLQSITLNGAPVTNTGTNGNVAFVIPTLGVGAANAQNYVITVNVNPDVTTSLVNTATVTAAGDTNPANDSSQITTAVTPTADITVTKTVNSAAASPGQQLTYTIVVSNAGPSTAAGVTAIDVLPAGLTFVSGTAPGGGALTATGQTVNVPIGSLAPAGTSQFTIIAAIANDFTGTLSNSVTVSTTTSEGGNALPNTAAVQTVVTIPDPNDASISGRVFLDRNNNGLFDPEDSGIGGVTMRLLQPGTGAVLATATTASDGTYTFAGLAAGTYDLQQIQPTGVRDGLERPGTGQTPVEIPDGIVRGILLARSQNATGFDFAELELLSKRRFLASTSG